MRLALLFVFSSLLFSNVFAQTTPQQVVVSFEKPEKFTDFSMRDMGPPSESLMKELEKFVRRQAKPYLRPGEKLKINFTDIDMAGDFGIRMGLMDMPDVRVVKDLYPPRLKFDYTLTDAKGKELKFGQENLSDLAFMGSAHLSDNLKYEKPLMARWFRKTLAVDK